MSTMRKILNFLILCVFFLSCFGCARLTEVSKACWGSSTKALEEKRVDAVKKTFQCRFDECFAAVLKIANKRKLTVFAKDKAKELIVVMTVPGCIDTTEVGIFFSDLETQTRVEIVSLSPKAQQVTADIVFLNLAKIFSEVK